LRLVRLLLQQVVALKLAPQRRAQRLEVRLRHIERVRAQVPAALVGAAADGHSAAGEGWKYTDLFSPGPGPHALHMTNRGSSIEQSKATPTVRLLTKSCVTGMTPPKLLPS
jgi:hypothetical protein